jgi:hypothetical protein
MFSLHDQYCDWEEFDAGKCVMTRQSRDAGGREKDIHHDLEAVEALGLGSLNLGRESLDQVLVDDAVRLLHQ